MIVHVTDTALVDSMWPTLEPMFARLTRQSHGCVETSDVLDEIKAGTQQLWVEWDAGASKLLAAMTTTIRVYPRRKAVCVIYVVGTGLKHWLPAFREEVERFALKQDITLLQGFFRRGWARVWPGCREDGVCLFKELVA